MARPNQLSNLLDILHLFFVVFVHINTRQAYTDSVLCIITCIRSSPGRCLLKIVFLKCFGIVRVCVVVHRVKSLRLSSYSRHSAYFSSDFRKTEMKIKAATEEKNRFFFCFKL